MQRMLHLAGLSVVLIAVSVTAFFSQTEKQHLMAAMFFESIATSLSNRIEPGMERLADLEALLGLSGTAFGDWTREAADLVAMETALRTEANVLRMYAQGDTEGVRQYQEEWYDDRIQNAIHDGVYPRKLGDMITDRTVFQEFIRIRNRYIDPETHRWKL
jgi:hypothetical protein